MSHRRGLGLLLALCAWLPQLAAAEPAPRPSAFPVVPAPELSADNPPPDFPRRADGTLDKDALWKELRARSTTPEALAEQARRVREESNEPGDRIHPFFGSERVLFANLDRDQGALFTLYRAVADARWYLAGALGALVIFVVMANQLRWRRLERTYLSGPARPAQPEAEPEA
jgi:hypothetical protein